MGFLKPLGAYLIYTQMIHQLGRTNFLSPSTLTGLTMTCCLTSLMWWSGQMLPPYGSSPATLRCSNTCAPIQCSNCASTPMFELRIHPNSNFLLAGETRKGATASEMIDRLIEIVPEAKDVRSHFTTQSSRLLEIFADKGSTHD